MIDHDWFLVELYFPDSDLMMFQLLQTSESWTPRTQVGLKMPTAATVANVAVTTQLDESAPTGRFHKWLGAAKVDGKKNRFQLYNMKYDVSLMMTTERGCRSLLRVLTRYCIYPPASRYKRRIGRG